MLPNRRVASLKLGLFGVSQINNCLLMIVVKNGEGATSHEEVNLHGRQQQTDLPLARGRRIAKVEDKERAENEPNRNQARVNQQRATPPWHAQEPDSFLSATHCFPPRSHRS